MNIKQKIMEAISLSKKNHTKKDLINLLNLSKDDLSILEGILNELIDEGLLVRIGKARKYALPERVGYRLGRLDVNPKGFGFLVIEDEEDIYINSYNLNKAMDKDKVLVKLLEKDDYYTGNKIEGEVVRIIDREKKEFIGIYQESKSFGFVVPDNAKHYFDIFIPKAKRKNAKNGQKVIAKINNWSDKSKNPEGEIVEVLGFPNEKGIDILSIAKDFGFELEFDKSIQKDLSKIDFEIPKKEYEDRKDLRDYNIFTIDGKDAKDLDDGVSLEKKGENYLLGVHIADVSHYVKENSYLDQEAFKRGTSVYLLDRVIPMLPEELSNDLCSLNPNTDKLTLSIFIEIDNKARVIDHKFYKSIINSKARLNYTDVSDILEEKEEQDKEHLKFKETLFMMKDLATLLMTKREDRGTLDFDFIESKIVLDENNKPIRIEEEERRIGNKIIEEFMIIANETVAEHFHWLNSSFIYRIHEEPDAEKIDNFIKIIHNLGYNIKGINNEIHPKSLQSIIKKVRSKDEEKLVNTMLLRSLKKAIYSTDNLGHFGLASDYYTHFTSPIRRYPDLIVHRLVKRFISGNLFENSEKNNEKLNKIANQSSDLERNAERAEREVMDLKKAEFMKDKIGDTFEGIISSVTNFGFFVELPNTIEGLVRLDLLFDYYNYDQNSHTLIGEQSKKILKIGMKVKVKLINVDLKNKNIDFTLIE